MIGNEPLENSIISTLYFSNVPHLEISKSDSHIELNNFNISSNRLLFSIIDNKLLVIEGTSTHKKIEKSNTEIDDLIDELYNNNYLNGDRLYLI